MARSTAKSREPDIPPDQVWRRPKDNLGYADHLRGLGGVVSPLLAGFSLAAIAQLLTTENPPPLTDWAVLALATSVAFLLHSMQLAHAALAADPSPATYLVWYPEALVEKDALLEVRRKQVQKYREMVRYWLRANVSYDVGLVAFLAGLVLLLIPEQWSGARIAAVSIAGAALLLEGWWAIANRMPDQLPHPVYSRTPAHVELTPLTARGMAAVLDPSRQQSIRDLALAGDDGQDPDGESSRPPEPMP